MKRVYPLKKIIKNLSLIFLEFIKYPKIKLNLLIYKLFRHLNLVKLPYYPTFLMIELSSYCNFNCQRCERRLVPKSLLNKHTDFNLFKSLKKIYPYVNTVYLCSGLGEGLLHPKFWKIQKMIKKSGTKIGFSSNGKLLNKKNILKMFECDTDEIWLPLDYIHKEVYNKHKMGGDYKTFFKNLKLLTDLKKEYNREKPVISLGYAIESTTIKDMPKLIEIAKKYDVDDIWFTITPVDIKKHLSSSPFFINHLILKRYFEETKKKAKRLGIKIRLPELNINKNKVCGTLWSGLCIFHNGIVSPCPYYRIPKSCFFDVVNGKLIQQETLRPAAVLGNINKEDIIGIWNNKTSQRWRKQMKDEMDEYPCKNCYFRYDLY